MCWWKQKSNILLNLFGYERNFEKFLKKNNIFDCKNIELFPLTFNLKKVLFKDRCNVISRLYERCWQTRYRGLIM